MDENQLVRESVAINRILSDVLEKQDKENKRLWIVVLVQGILLAIMAFVMIVFGSWAINNGQQLFDNALASAFEHIAEIGVTKETVTTTTT